MKRAWFIALAVLAVIVLPGGAVVGVVAVVNRRRTRAEFLALIQAEVARQLSELRPDLTDAAREVAGRIVAAMAAHETGYGATVAWREGWNFSNLTAGSYWTGDVTPGPDTEPDGRGGWRNITQAFRRYPALPAAVSDYFRALNWPAYRPARDLLMAGDLEGFARALAQGGWYTADPGEYVTAMRDAFDAQERVA